MDRMETEQPVVLSVIKALEIMAGIDWLTVMKA